MNPTPRQLRAAAQRPDDSPEVQTDASRVLAKSPGNVTISVAQALYDDVLAPLGWTLV